MATDDAKVSRLSRLVDGVIVVILIGLAVYGVSWLFWRTIEVLTPPPARCAVTLPSGDTVTRYGCVPYKRSGGVLYCDEVDYAPAAWVTVTCEAAP